MKLPLQSLRAHVLKCLSYLLNDDTDDVSEEDKVPLNIQPFISNANN